MVVRVLKHYITYLVIIYITYITLLWYFATCTVYTYIHRYAKLNATGLGCLASRSEIMITNSVCIYHHFIMSE